MDFTQKTYRNFILKLKENIYSFLSFSEFLITAKAKNLTNDKTETTDKTTILRHDIDRQPNNALEMAKLENELGIKGTYYFRIVPESFDEDIIKEIANMGHEIGYHYEDVDFVYSKIPKFQNSRNSNEDLIDAAYESFCKNLEKIRKVAEIKTICAHGSPLSRFDNKMLWDKYDYKKLGIIGDAHLDIDWDQFAYLTDTGRRWNGDSVSVRDKVNSKYNFNFKSTLDIIANIGKLPDKVMFTIHPERWNDKPLPWVKQLVEQNIKNVVKKYFYVKKLK